MSVWIGALQVVSDAFHAVMGLRNDTRLGASTRWLSLEQLSRNMFGAAAALEGMPETHDFVAQLREMGDRYANRNSLTNEELDADVKRLKTMRAELSRRVHEGPG